MQIIFRAVVGWAMPEVAVARKKVDSRLFMQKRKAFVFSNRRMENSQNSFFGLSAIVDENRRHWKRFALARLLKESEKGLKRGWACSEKAFNFNQSFAQFTSEVCMRSHNLCQKLKLRDFTSFTVWKSKREIEARDLYCVVFYCWGNNIQAIKTQLKLDPCLSLPTI